MEWVNYTHDTTYGPIAINWNCRDGEFTITCDVPVGATATVWIPFEGEAPKVKTGDNVIAKGVRDGYALYKVKSGRYSFKSNI